MKFEWFHFFLKFLVFAAKAQHGQFSGKSGIWHREVRNFSVGGCIIRKPCCSHQEKPFFFGASIKQQYKTLVPRRGWRYDEHFSDGVVVLVSRKIRRVKFEPKSPSAQEYLQPKRLSCLSPTSFASTSAEVRYVPATTATFQQKGSLHWIQNNKN